MNKPSLRLRRQDLNEKKLAQRRAAKKLRERRAAQGFEHGFIRAEVISYEDFIACKGEAGAKEKGKMRLEGKDFVVRDGDVMHFRFNV